MKICTDLEQSKKLAEILPIESADMMWDDWSLIDEGWKSIVGYYPDIEKDYGRKCYPAWSLAALIDMLPNEISTGENFADKYQIDIRKYDWEDGTTWYQIAYGNDRGRSGEWHDMINTGEKENIIDCCYQMILKLKERNLLK